jgi:hypothetical protein
MEKTSKPKFKKNTNPNPKQKKRKDEISKSHLGLKNRWAT